MRHKKSLAAGVADFFEDFRAARRCAVALESGSTPPEAALRRLGLDAKLFERHR
ncbi:hypothetical protein [Jiella mangrovi]|uniref:Uncharacterized protein n=1 Tax=Jiella mangrovi TaxID=2821407 RepID=A0ABS4BMW8_9HYPH|nr:hypothetical protein [Jiella mangrovi]MBP0618075.1 hypothetical protein [Jiella mangrovi]